MDERPRSPIHDAPEAVPNQPRNEFGFVGSDDYEYYEPPPSAFDRQRSPVPEYQQFDQQNTSPRISAQSPPPPPAGSDITRSPQVSDGGFTKSRPLSPSAQYSEIHSPAPEIVYNNQQEKEAVFVPPPTSKVPSYQAYPVPGIQHQNSGDRPQVWTDSGEVPQEQQQKKKKPFYKRWLFIAIIALLVVLIAVGIALGVVFGTRKSHDDSPTPTPTQTAAPPPPANTSTPNNPGVDINTSVGGYINNDYYSESGAWNGSGIAIAGANPNKNEAIYAFYQDHTGAIQYTLMDSQNRWTLVGPVNDNSHKALNGTPLSTVLHYLGAELVWHLFYIDEDYIIRERIMTNTSDNGPAAIWRDGPLNDLKLSVWKSNSIGLQACYWGNYYGQWSYEDTQASAGIHLWYASDATVFQQYSWTNGTSEWIWDQQWPGLSGNGGVGCQTWDTGMTEYVWFVDTKNSLAMYWRDNNRTGPSTPDHPTGEWKQVEIGVDDVQKDSGLGYTNYMIWQSEDTTIRGANITWGAENTTIAAGNGEDGLDTWTLQYGGEDIHAIRGTHLSITAVSTVGAGALLLTFFQEEGDDVQMYTRDAFNSGALWQQAAQDPVVPDKE